MAKKLLKLRPCVAWFAQHMERKLRKHDRERGPRGWQEDGASHLYDRLQDEASELEGAIRRTGEGGKDADRIIGEAADVANFAMMIADNEEQAR